jgi:hypothetical protein
MELALLVAEAACMRQIPAQLLHRLLVQEKKRT